MVVPTVLHGTELGTIGAALADAAGGHRRILLVEGRFGIGKSTLLRAAAELARDRGFRVRALAGPEGLSADLVADLVAESAETAKSAETAESAGSAGSPVLLVVDDVDAADHETRLRLGRLARESTGSQLLLLSLCRRDHPVLPTDLTHGAEVRWLQLQPWDAAAVGALLGELGRDDLSELVLEATGGDPLLVRAVLEWLERGSADASDPDAIHEAAIHEAAVHEAAVSGTVPHLVGHLDAMAPGALAVARAAAVLATDAELHRVGALSGVSTDFAAEVADMLVTDGLVEESWPLVFRHPVLAEAVLASMPGSLRSQLHDRAADLLTDEGATPARIAAHLLHTQPAQDATRVELLRGVAANELERGAASSAVSLLERALREPPPAADLAQVMLELGRAEAKADVPGALDRLAAAARLGGEPRWRAAAHHERGWALVASGQVPEAMQAYQEALADAPAEDREHRLDLSAELLAMAQMETSLPVDIEAIRAALPEVEPGNRSLAARRAYGALAHLEFSRGTSSDVAVDLALRSVGDGLVPPDALVASPAFMLARDVLVQSDVVDRPRQLSELAEEWALAQGAPTLLVGARWSCAKAAWQRGDLVEVDRISTTILEACGAGLVSPLAAFMILPLRVRALVALDRPDEARDLMAGFGLIDLPREMLPFSEALFARAGYWLATDEVERAVEELRFTGARLVGYGSLNPAAFPWRSVAATGLLRLARHEEAIELVDEELALAHAYGAARPIGTALLARGVVIGGRSGLVDLEQAVEVLERSSDTFTLARALVELGSAQRRAGQRRISRQALQEGRRLAGVCGVPSLVRRADDELLATGARSLERATSGVEALTASELRIATMAGDGARNSEIALELSVSLKTVEMHLSRAYRKLRIARRGDVAAALSVEDQVKEQG